MAPKWNGTIGRFDLVEVGVVLLEEVCVTVEVGLEVSYVIKIQPSASVYFLLPAYQRAAAPSPVSCLPACRHAPHHDNNGRNP